MNALRLQSARGLRTPYVFSSYSGHIPPSPGACRSRLVVIRSYAITKKSAAPPVESAEDAKPSNSHVLEAEVSCAQAEKSPAKEQLDEKSTQKPAAKTKNGPHSPQEAEATGASPALAHLKASETSVEFLKETLEILKSLQAAQNSKDDDATRRGSQTKRSLKSQFPPIHGSRNEPSQRQAKLLEGTLEVLKNALMTHADPSKPTTPVDKALPPSHDSAAPKTDGAAGTNRVNSAVSKSFAAVSADTKASVDSLAAQEEPPQTGAPNSEAVDTREEKKKKQKVENMGWGSKARLIRKIKPGGKELQPVKIETAPVPRVEYGLDRVLFNEGVYVLQDPRTRVYNFDPYLATIMPVDEFDFEALTQYVTSSKDTRLINAAKKHKKLFTGSTSSMTSTLAHFHYLLSAWRPINPERISKAYEPDSQNFGAYLRAPAATFLRYKDGVYAIDADKEFDTETILSMLGKSMEKLLTCPKEEFEKYRRANSHLLTEKERNEPESYHYTTFGDFMMRSQLDAYDPRLPGTGVFDLKTRAVVSIRMDAKNHERGLDYEIRQRQGQWESFEREYFDMIRLAFLKYSLQVRMGRMDGIFVAYHNTQRIFGFQYIPLEEMDLSIHGTLEKTIGNLEFKASLELWEEMLKKASAKFPGQSLRVHVETRPSTAVPFMYFFAEPVTDDEIQAVQDHGKEEAADFQLRVLGIKPKPEDDAELEPATGETEASEDALAAREDVHDNRDGVQPVEEEENSEHVWEDMMKAVEETMENDAQGISAIREAIREALEQSGLLHARSLEEAENYTESLLKAIVDVKIEQSNLATGEPGNSQENDPSPRPKPFDFLYRWFGGQSAAADSTSKQDSSPEVKEDQQTSNAPGLESMPTNGTDPVPTTLAGRADQTGTGSVTRETGGGKPDDSLKDLIVKLTSRVGSSTEATKVAEELTEDQAKLRNFESILLEMMPNTQGPPSDCAGKATAGESDGASKEVPAPGEEVPQKPVLGLILTIRNMVNNVYVQRPEKLKCSDKWNVEYTIEEVPDDKVQSLYALLKKRRQTALEKSPGKDFFSLAYRGLLKHYSYKGKKFRETENKAARNLPIRIVTQVEPLAPNPAALASTMRKQLEKFLHCRALARRRQQTLGGQDK